VTAMLGMYDVPQLAGANDRFWAAIRSELGEGPEALERGRDFWEIWRDPDMVLSQTCGMPYRTALHGQVRLVGTPDYGLPGCAPGYYNSVIIARADAPGDTMANFSGQRLGYNDPVSQSGWAAPMTHARRQNARFDQLVETGGHMASATAVAEGSADIAGIDALTWALIQQFQPLARQLREVERTEPTPGLPYITAWRRDPVPIRSAVENAINALSREDRELLHLRGLVQIPDSAYLAIPTPPGPRS